MTKSTSTTNSTGVRLLSVQLDHGEQHLAQIAVDEFVEKVKLLTEPSGDSTRFHQKQVAGAASIVPCGGSMTIGETTLLLGAVVSYCGYLDRTEDSLGRILGAMQKTLIEALRYA